MEISLTKANKKLSIDDDLASQDDEFITTRMGKSIARIFSYQSPVTKRDIGWLKGKISIPSDFDEWPEDEAAFLGIKK